MKQEVDQIAVEESVIVIIVVRNIHADHDFLKEVSCKFEGAEFCIFLLPGIHLISGLDINAAIAVVHNEVNLTLDAFILFSLFHNADIYGIATLY